VTRTKIAESTLRRFGLIGGIALLFALAGFVALGVVLGGKVPPLFATARKAVEQTQSAKEPPLFATARRAVEQTLIDPQSAQFEDLKIVGTVEEGRLVCGTINARNQVGGYAGRRPFVFVFDDYSDLALVIENPLQARVFRVYIEQCHPQIRIPADAEEAIRLSMAAGGSQALRCVTQECLR
jgi:hypothetical protein